MTKILLRFENKFGKYRYKSVDYSEKIIDDPYNAFNRKKITSTANPKRQRVTENIPSP